MGREEKSERSTTRGVAKMRMELNRDNIVFLLLLYTGQKVVLRFSDLQIFGYLFRPSSFILHCPSIVF